MLLQKKPVLYKEYLKLKQKDAAKPISFLNNLLSKELSFNKFSGTLSKDLWKDTSEFSYKQHSVLFLQENRLSGNIPNSLIHSKNINILQGNIFSCDISGNDLPIYDPNRFIYQCGSNPFNIAI